MKSHKILENRLFLIEERSRILESEIEDTKRKDRTVFH
jgi:hypothetical protein